MKTFTDSADRTWTVQMNIGAAKRVRDLLNVDLLALDKGDPPVITRLGIDPVFLCDVIYVLVKPQADKEDVSDVQFGEAMGGEAIHQAQNAFYEELALFFRGLGRTDLATACVTQRKIIDMAVKRVNQRVKAVNLEELVTQAEEETFGNSSLNSPES